jgi:hypothetical protein
MRMRPSFNRFRRFRFSLAALFVAFAVLAAGMSWTLREYRRQSDAIDSLRAKGAFFLLLNDDGSRFVVDAHDRSVARALFGKYRGARAVQMELSRPQEFTDDDLRHVAALPDLEWLAISESMVTDRGLRDIAKLRNLQRIDLEGCPVSQSAVAQLRRDLPAAKIWSDWDD